MIGGSGFLGRHLLERAVMQGASAVLSASRQPGGDRGPGPTSLWCDARLDATSGELESRLDELRPTHCILAAALSRGADCERDPDLAEELNVRTPARVAAWCARSGVRLVHVSTDLVFSGEPPRASGFRESDPCAPLHVYGRTKAAGEQAVLRADSQALVVRLPLLFGDSHGRGRGASDALLAQLAKGRTPRLFRDEWRTPMDVSDAAGVLLELAGSRAGSWPGGLLHVGGPERLSRYELGLEILRAHDPSGAAPEDRIESVLRADLGLTPPRPRDVSLDSS